MKMHQDENKQIEVEEAVTASKENDVQAQLAKKQQKKLIRLVIASVLAACSIITIYWAAIEFYLRDFENISYIEFSYNTDAVKGDDNYGITITKLNRNANYPKNFRIPNKLLGRPVTGIGSNAFGACDRLVSITMPNTVTSIDTQAFINCSKLAKVQFSPNIDYVGVNAMLGTKWLADRKEGPVIISEVFYVYKGALPNGTVVKGERKTGDPEPSASLFYINDLDEGRDIKYIADGAFLDQRGIVYFEFPDDIEIVTARILEGCTSLETVIIHDDVKTIGQAAFKNTTALEEIDLPDNITSIGLQAFAYSAIKSIEIPSAVPVLDNSTFEGCNNLADVKLPENLISINDRVFDGCSLLEEIEFPENLTRIGNFAFRKTALHEVVIPEGVDIISESVFENCSDLESITLHDGITAIRANAFKNNTSLASIVLPAYLQSIGLSAFEKTPLAEITIPYTVRKIDEKAFFNCESLKKIIFQENNTKRKADRIYLEFIGLSAFENSGLEGEINIPNTVYTISPRAFAKTKISKITLPINLKFTAISEELFADCYNLVELEIPATVTNIKNKVFLNCTALRSVYIGKSVINLGEFIFLGCDPALVISCESNTIVKDDNSIKKTWDVIEVIENEEETIYVYASINYGVPRP